MLDGEGFLISERVHFKEILIVQRLSFDGDKKLLYNHLNIVTINILVVW